MNGNYRGGSDPALSRPSAHRLYRVLVRFPGQRHRVALTVRGRDEWEAERSALSHLEAHRLPGGVVGDVEEVA